MEIKTEFNIGDSVYLIKKNSKGWFLYCFILHISGSTYSDNHHLEMNGGLPKKYDLTIKSIAINVKKEEGETYLKKIYGIDWIARRDDEYLKYEPEFNLFKSIKKAQKEIERRNKELST